jgi:hypothetical protein
MLHFQEVGCHPSQQSTQRILNNSMNIQGRYFVLGPYDKATSHYKPYQMWAFWLLSYQGLTHPR